MAKRKKLSADDLLRMLSAPGDTCSKPQRADGTRMTDSEAASVAARVAEKIAQGKVCWCRVRKYLQGNPPCPSHPEPVVERGGR